MATIISRMTARKRQARPSYANNKCLYSLPEFSSGGFKPELHNLFILRRRQLAKNVKRQKLEDELLQNTWRNQQVCSATDWKKMLVLGSTEKRSNWSRSSSVYIWILPSFSFSPDNTSRIAAYRVDLLLRNFAHSPTCSSTDLVRLKVVNLS